MKQALTWQFSSMRADRNKAQADTALLLLKGMQQGNIMPAIVPDAMHGVQQF